MDKKKMVLAQIAAWAGGYSRAQLYYLTEFEEARNQLFSVLGKSRSQLGESFAIRALEFCKTTRLSNIQGATGILREVAETCRTYPWSNPEIVFKRVCDSRKLFEQMNR